MLAHGECAPSRLLSVDWLPYQARISERGHGPGDRRAALVGNPHRGYFVEVSRILVAFAIPAWVTPSPVPCTRRLGPWVDRSRSFLPPM
jgi:hypothetical protein